MKKSRFRKRIQVVFWLVFVAACLWLSFVPPGGHEHAPNGVTVKVNKPAEPQPETPVEKPALPSGGEEQTPQPVPTPQILPPQSGVTAPVLPEKETALPAGQHPKIAIVIDDVGVDLKGSEKAIALPAPITLSFLPYAVRLREQAKEARDNGHELMLHMPMEPIGHEDPGPGALFVDLPMDELQQRFETALASFTGFDGVNNHMGSKFTAYADGMNMVVDELQQRHLFYLDSRTSAQSVSKQIAEQKNLPTIGRDVFLDDDQASDMIRKQLQETERVARRKGSAVAIGHPHATTMAVLAEWIPEAQKQGFDFVPVHDLIKK